MSIPRPSRPVSELDDHELGIEYHRLEFRWMFPPPRAVFRLIGGMAGDSHNE